MAANTKIRGKSLVLTIDEVDISLDVKSVELVANEGSNTFGNTMHTLWTMNFTADVSEDAGSAYDAAWSKSGEIVPFTMKRHGSEVVYTGTVEIGRKPSVGTTVNEFSEFSVTWDVVGDVDRDTGESSGV